MGEGEEGRRGRREGRGRKGEGERRGGGGKGRGKTVMHRSGVKCYVLMHD